MSKSKTWRIAGINFDFRHMDHLLWCAHEEANAEIVGICHDDPGEMEAVSERCAIPADRIYTDWKHCMEESRPDLVILCPANHEHGDWVERIAPYGVHILVEKPFAHTLKDADRMIAEMRKGGGQLGISWPLAWYPPHLTAYRLLQEGRIGELEEVHFYDGNRSSIMDRTVPEPRLPTLEEKLENWYYDPVGGGVLIDYLGYGVTIATWYFGGRKPSEVTTVKAGDPRVPVDEQSVTVARYGNWLSTFQTRWGTFTDPWEHQPQPKCGFVLKGTAGTISNYDYEETVRIQTPDKPEGEVLPVDKPVRPRQNAVQYFLHCLEAGAQIDGPLSVETSRIGQEIVDAAVRSAAEGRAVQLA